MGEEDGLYFILCLFHFICNFIDCLIAIHNPLEINKTGVKVFGNSQNAIIITDAQNGWPNSAVIVNAGKHPSLPSSFSPLFSTSLCSLLSSFLIVANTIHSGCADCKSHSSGISNWNIHSCWYVTPLHFILFCFYFNLYFVLFCFVLFCFVLFCFVLFCFVLFCFVLYCIVLYCIVLYCIVLYCIVLYCIILYCIVLYYWFSFY